MRQLLIVPMSLLALLGLAYAGMGLSADGAIHEIEGLIGALIFAVVVGAGYVGSAVMEARQPPQMPPQPMQWQPPQGGQVSQ